MVKKNIVTFEQLHHRDFPVAYSPERFEIKKYFEQLPPRTEPSDLISLAKQYRKSYMPMDVWTVYPDGILPIFFQDKYCHANTMLHAKTLLNNGKTGADFQVVTGLYAVERVCNYMYVISSHSWILYQGRILDLSLLHQKQDYTVYEYFGISYDPEIAVDNSWHLFFKQTRGVEVIPLGALKDIPRLRST
ncbi:MAG: hypothetical protein WCG55_01455 [bacterium]